MVTTLSIAQAQEQLAQLPERFATESEPQAITVTRQGQPVMVLLPWELYESMLETLEILGDAEAMSALQQSEEQLARGDVIEWSAAKAQLGL